MLTGIARGFLVVQAGPPGGFSSAWLRLPAALVPGAALALRAVDSLPARGWPAGLVAD